MNDWFDRGMIFDIIETINTEFELQTRGGHNRIKDLEKIRDAQVEFMKKLLENDDTKWKEQISYMKGLR